MEFGYGLVTAQRPPESDRSYATVYEDAIRLAQVAEESGFDAVWTSEHHGFVDGYAPSVLPLCAALARETETIDVGTGIALAPLYQPLRLAEDAATVDLLSSGRFRLGIANGYVEREFEAFNVPLADRAPRVEDAIDVCRRGWNGEAFDHDGHRVDLEGVRVQPTPAQDNGPPILLGGVAEAAVRRAGRLADGYLGIIYHGDDWGGPFTVEQFRRNVETVREERGNLDGFTPAVVRYANVADTDDEAWATLLPHLAYLERRYAEVNDRDDPARWVPETMDDAHCEALRAGALVGSPDTVRDQLRRLDERVPGDLHVIARLYHPTRPVDEQIAAVRKFGRDVIAAVN
jgi:alkanesulfonate monooxygenase SsuD/methylene tetrahydromethanopterin reductase-like flavin-dependent oxidoreductase (luciferase family)